jgi:pyruvate,water dikinase
VLSAEQLFELGTALDAIHRRFSPAYGRASGNTGWYALEVDFKFDGEPGETPGLFIKQARPYPGRGQ